MIHNVNSQLVLPPFPSLLFPFRFHYNNYDNNYVLVHLYSARIKLLCTVIFTSSVESYEGLVDISARL